jgi:hypothetical protein
VEAEADKTAMAAAASSPGRSRRTGLIDEWLLWPLPPPSSGVSRFDLPHLSGELAGREYPLLEEDVCKSGDPALVVAQFRDHLGLQRVET